MMGNSKLQAYLALGEKLKAVELPFIPKEQDVMQIGSRKYKVIQVKYKEVDHNFVPVIYLAKEG
jgi:hypothetical protein